MNYAAAHRLLHHPATAWVILLFSFLLTGIAWYLSDSFIRQRAQDRFAFQTADLVTNIQRRMLEYEATLRGGLGLFLASEEVTRDEWRTYAQTLQLDRYFPGIQGYGYSQVIAPAEKTRHEARIRAEGFPAYALRPGGERDLYTAIIYLEPFNARNQRAFGYDMFSEATRRAAMERARDTGLPTLSGRVILVQETASDVQHGVLMYVPVYRRGKPQGNVEERRAALQGFVYAPFRMRDLMQGILGADQVEIEFALHDGPAPSEDTILYSSWKVGPSGVADAGTTFRNQKQIEVAGRTWTLQVHARPGFLSQAEESQPLVVAVGGILVDLLLFVIIGSIARQQQRAEALAREMTVDLRRSNDDLEQFAYAASHDMRQPLRMVTSYLQLLKSELAPLLDAEKRQHFHFAIDGARRMDEMLVALLEYSRIGHVATPQQDCDSRALLDEALRYLAPAIEETRAVVRVSGTWSRVHGTRDELVRLFQNLVDNALKYRLPERIPNIVIDAMPAEGMHRFTVRDNGIGLLPGQEERLFKVFERLQPRDKYSGTGIGLALCRKIVEHHGGSIGVNSAGGNLGCTFSFTLPAAADSISRNKNQTD